MCRIVEGQEVSWGYSENSKGGLVDGSTGRVDGLTLAEAVERYSICKEDIDTEASRIYHSAPANRFSTDSALDE